MKALLIGGTGTISLPITRKLLQKGWEVTLLNRGNKNDLAPGTETVRADAKNEQDVKEKLRGRSFDVVAQFIAFKPDEMERDIRLYRGMTKQYIFISSASAYQKPPRNPVVDESVPLHNPYWQYSRDKAACEEILRLAYDRDFFPMTIVRPSHTYREGTLPLAIRGNVGFWQVLERIKRHQPVLIPGDGTNLWTVTWADDFADGFIGLMGNPHAIGEAVHITSDEALTWNQIYGTISQILGAPFIPCHVPSDVLGMAQSYDFAGALLGDKANCALFDTGKLKRLVPGFVAGTRFDQGARTSIEYLLAHPALQTPDPEFDTFCDKVVLIMKQAEEQIAKL